MRLLVGGTGMEELKRLKRYALCKTVLGSMLVEGGWTVLATDLKILTHPKFGGLWDEVEELTLLARERGVSVVTDMQRVSGQPRESTDQATWMAIGYTRDVDAVNRLGEMMGRSRAEMRGALSALGDLPYAFRGEPRPTKSSHCHAAGESLGATHGNRFYEPRRSEHRVPVQPTPSRGGEYYRATRPGALANWKWKWQTAACVQMATSENDAGGKLSFVTPNQFVVTPEISSCARFANGNRSGPTRRTPTANSSWRTSTTICGVTRITTSSRRSRPTTIWSGSPTSTR